MVCLATRMTTRVAGLATILLAAPTLGAEAEPLIARGNEPSFLISIGEDEVVLQMPLDGITFRSSNVTRSTVDGHPRIEVSAGGNTLDVTIEQHLCADTMTGMPFPVAVRAEFNGQKLNGCGGSTFTAIEGGWRVLALEGKPLPDGTIATIAFEAPDKVSGKSGCNRYFGAFKLDAERLAIGPLGATRMACRPDEMEIERRFLDLAARVTRATPGENGRLKLMTGDDEAMLLDHAD